MPKVVHIFRPHLTDPADLEAISVAREPLIKEILKPLSKWKPGSSRQHHLFIGPRGIGKSHLLILLKHRINESPKLSKKWAPVLFAEEEFGISSVADFLIKTLLLLSECTGDENIRISYEKVRYEEDNEKVVDLSLDALKQYHESGKCGILLLLENVNRIFGSQYKDKSQLNVIRKILIEEDYLTLFCTSPVVFNQVIDEKEPLYEFFKLTNINELSMKEQEEMIIKLAELENNDDFLEQLPDYRSRLKALYHFTGGNPRLAVMLYELIANQNLASVKDELSRLLDQLTPFYQDRMKEVSDQEAKVLEALAFLPIGSTPSELSKHSRMPSELVRANLSKLKKAGYIKAERRRKKKTIYIIPERFFRIWHQMNRSRGSTKQIQYLLEFFKGWYSTPEERDNIWNQILSKLEKSVDKKDGDKSNELIEMMDYIARVSEGTERYNREFEKLSHVYKQEGEVSALSKIADLDKEFGDDWEYYLKKGMFLSVKLFDWNGALIAFRLSKRIGKKQIEPILGEAISFTELSLPDEAKNSYEEAGSLLFNLQRRSDENNESSTLLRILKQDKNQFMVSVSASIIGHTYDKSITGSLIEILETTREIWRKIHCLKSLQLIKDPQSIPTINKFLKSKSEKLVLAAITALGEIGSENSIDILSKVMINRSNRIKASALHSLGEIGSSKAVSIIELKVADKDKIIRSQALEALGKIGSVDSINLLEESLNDRAPQVRAIAADALGQIGSSQSIESLVEVLKYDKDEKVRSSAFIALGKIGIDSAVNNLQYALNDSSEYVRTTSIVLILGYLTHSSPLLLSTSRDYESFKNVMTDTLLSIVHRAEKQTFQKELFYKYILKAIVEIGEIDIYSTVLSQLESFIDNSKLILNPHYIALEYLKSDRDPSILERQQPEMREAVMLLVDAFDEGVKKIKDSSAES